MPPWAGATRTGPRGPRVAPWPQGLRCSSPTTATRKSCDSQPSPTQAHSCASVPPLWLPKTTQIVTVTKRTRRGHVKSEGGQPVVSPPVWCLGGGVQKTASSPRWGRLPRPGPSASGLSLSTRLAQFCPRQAPSGSISFWSSLQINQDPACRSCHRRNCPHLPKGLWQALYKADALLSSTISGRWDCHP